MPNCNECIFFKPNSTECKIRSSAIMKFRNLKLLHGGLDMKYQDILELKQNIEGAKSSLPEKVIFWGYYSDQLAGVFKDFNLTYEHKDDLSEEYLSSILQKLENLIADLENKKAQKLSVECLDFQQVQ
jgi:hypothetical protein